MHFRSATGSSLAVEVAEGVLREVDAALRSGGALDAERDLWIREQIVARWRAACLADAESHPFEPGEALRLGGVGPGTEEQLPDPVLAYGSTLLAALASETLMVLVQIGDGDIIAVDPSGAQLRPFPRDARHVANLTTSLCLATAVDDMRVVSLPLGNVSEDLSAPVLVLLSTDGYVNSFVSAEAFERVVGPQILAQVRERGLAWVGQVLPRSLRAAAARGSGDDVTLGILTCEDAPADAIAPGQGRGDAPVTLGGLVVVLLTIVVVALCLWRVLR